MIKQKFACCFTGHRPASLPWGFRESGEAYEYFIQDLRYAICQEIEDGCACFLTGMALGVDMIAAEIVIDLKRSGVEVALVACIPCPSQDAKWASAARARYADIVKACDEVVTVSPCYDNECMNRRNRYMAERADTVIAVWNGKPSGTANTVRYSKKLGRKVTVIDPTCYETIF